MMYDELFPENSTMVVDYGSSPSKTTSRLVSAPHDDERRETGDAAPVSQCSSGESSAPPTPKSVVCVTGRFSSIEYEYHVDARVLGAGHHGSVRECVDRRTRRRCAVKTIRKDDPNVKPGGLAREIALLGEVKHRNVVRLVDVFEDAEHVHIVTDLCTGGELFDRIVAKSSDPDNDVPCFAEDEAARLLHQILEAVEYMHENDIAHRDIKPENILFESADEDSLIKIIDFGLARKHRGDVGEPPMSTIVGTPYYICPDVLRRKYDKRCDLWSVGVIAYILLCGYPPFNGDNSAEVLDAVRRGCYRFDPEDWSGISHEARDFIRRLLQRDAEKRMSVEMAFCHPWMMKHVNTNSRRREDKSQQDNGPFLLGRVRNLWSRQA